MYQVTGEIINVFNSPKTEKYDASFKVQLLGDLALQSGQSKKELMTLNVPEMVYNSLIDQVGSQVTFPIGFFINDGRLTTFFPKGEANNIKIHTDGYGA